MEEYVYKLSMLMNDPQMRKDIQKNILTKAKEYSVEVIVKQWDELFKSVL